MNHKSEIQPVDSKVGKPNQSVDEISAFYSGYVHVCWSVANLIVLVGSQWDRTGRG